MIGLLFTVKNAAICVQIALKLRVIALDVIFLTFYIILVVIVKF